MKCSHLWLLSDGPAHFNFECDFCGCVLGVYFTLESDRAVRGGQWQATFRASARLLHDVGTLCTIEDMLTVSALARQMFANFVSQVQQVQPKKRHKKRGARVA